VLPLRQQISKVEIYDSRAGEEIALSYTCDKIDSNIEDVDFYETTCKAGLNMIESSRQVALVSSGGVEILCPVAQIQGDKYSIQKLPDVSPKIYCAFPMIGSDNKFFPVITNCNRFIPNTERNGIEISEYDLKNRNLVLDAVSGFNKLVTIAENNQWDDGFNLLDFGKIDFNNPKTNKWYNINLFNQVVNRLKIAKLIKEGENYYSISQTYLPYFDKRSSDKVEQLTRIHNFGSKLLTYVTPNSDVLLQWYEAVDYELYNANKMDCAEIAKVLARDSKSLSTIKKRNEKDENLVKCLVEFVSFLLENEEEELLNKFRIIPNQNEDFCLLKEIKLDKISHKSLNDKSIEDLKIINSEINVSSDVKSKLIHNLFQPTLINSIKDRDVTFINLCREIDDGVKDYKGDYRDKKFVTILKRLFTWLNSTNFSNELIIDYFPYFGNEKSQLYLNTKSSEELEYAFDIDISGKSEALAKIAKSSLSAIDIETIAKNSSVVMSFIKWVNQKIEDNPNEELGKIGEEFLYSELCKIFGEDRVKWDNKSEYDFRVFESDMVTTKYFVDAKTTMSGLGNTDNVPFYMRTAQWRFLEDQDAYGKYIIARLEKKGINFNVKYLKIGIEPVK
jgi:hypothetical protein